MKKIYLHERKAHLSFLLALGLITAPIPALAETEAPHANAIATVNQQKVTISGVVKDATGEPIIGASVVEKGNTMNGVITDMDGRFSLSVSGNAVDISYVGYKTQTVALKPGVTDYSIVLHEDTEVLDEVVVVGYGTQKKVNLTGSVSAVTTDEIATRVNSDVLASVQGQVPGVTIISRPGSTPTINFRGRGNLGTSAPLYVIDGAISDATMFSALDPNSIESISFLKDAASSSIYGARAAYGVVLVTTKGGKEGDMRITYDGYVGFQSATYTPKVLSSEWYARLSNEAALNDNPNAELPYTDEEIAMFRDGTNPDMYPNTNWYDLVLDDHAITTKHTIGINGGTQKLKYFTSLGYTYNDKFIPYASSNRYNFLTNVTADVKKWLTFRGNINYVQNDDKNDGGGVIYTHLLTIPSTYVAKQSNGEWGSYEAGSPAALVNIQRNPLRRLEEGGWSNNTWRNTMLNFGLDLKPVKGLTITGEMAYKLYDYKAKSYTASTEDVKDFVTGNPITSSGTAIASSQMTYTWQETTRLTYNAMAKYDWKNDNHSVNALLGTSYEHYRYQQQYSYRKNFPTNSSTDMNGGSSASADTFAKGGSNENKLMSYFGRVNYSFMDRYLLEVNMRADASSRFHKNNRWGYFPSFSAGWRISEEAFMEDIEWVDNLKIRGSWGQLGNINNVGDYDYFATYAQGSNYNFNDVIVNGILESKLPNYELGWETVTITDIGVDVNLFDNKLNIVADWYNKVTNDILLTRNIAAEVGASSSPSANLGKVSNKGIEFSISHNNQIGDLGYSVGLNMSKNWNEIVFLGENNPTYSGNWIYMEGYPIGTFYGYRTDGLLTQEDIDNGNYITDGLKPNAGDIKYVDRNNNGKLDEGDKDCLDSDVPDFTYGVNLSLNYKNFELSVFGQGVTGTKVYFDMENAWAFSDYASPREYHLKRWTVDNPNPNADYPRIYSRTSSHSSFNQKLSDYWLFDADYFRIKNITFGYNFPKSMIQSWGIQALKAYVAAENPFTIRADHRMEDFDPETASGRGVNTRGTRTISFGVNLTF